ncbi:MAG: OmpA family protein [Caulobacteraceae bacterium]
MDQAAQAAQQKANQGSQTADQALQKANQALQRTDALAAGKADARFVYTDQHSGVSVQFATARWTLSPEAKTVLTDFAARLKSDNKDVYLQILGRADSRGGVAYNRTLGGRRALEVQRFLADQGVALSRMDVVSWGEEKNAAEGNDGARRSDRRVDVAVFG